MNSDNKQIRDVADVAARIMAGLPITEKLHPNQQKLDVHEPEKDELTSDDFKKLRAGKKADVKKEEVESIDEADLLAKRDKPNDFGTRPGLPQGKNLLKVRMKADQGKHTKPNLPEEVELDEEDAYEKDRYAVKNGKAVKDNPTHQGSPNYKDQPHHVYATSAENALKNHTKKEEVELDEVKMADLPSTKVQGRSYGASRPEPHAVDVMKGPKEKELKDIDAEKKKKKFSEMVNLYQEKGLKSLSEMLVKEEPDNEQFTKELEDAKAKSEGKKRNTEIAKGSVQAVKSEEIDINDINGVQMSTIEERMMTEPEKEKKEDIVKGMKKGMAGFKERYGSRANDVMYATATKQAMK